MRPYLFLKYHERGTIKYELQFSGMQFICIKMAGLGSGRPNQYLPDVASKATLEDPRAHSMYRTKVFIVKLLLFKQSSRVHIDDPQPLWHTLIGSYYWWTWRLCPALHLEHPLLEKSATVWFVPVKSEPVKWWSSSQVTQIKHVLIRCAFWAFRTDEDIHPLLHSHQQQSVIYNWSSLWKHLTCRFSAAL